MTGIGGRVANHQITTKVNIKMSALMPMIIFVRRDTSVSCFSVLVSESSLIPIFPLFRSLSVLPLGLGGDTPPKYSTLAFSSFFPPLMRGDSHHSVSVSKLEL